MSQTPSGEGTSEEGSRRRNDFAQETVSIAPTPTTTITTQPIHSASVTTLSLAGSKLRKSLSISLNEHVSAPVSTTAQKQLLKFGWIEGQSLGKRQKGLTTHIKAIKRIDDQAGLGIEQYKKRSAIEKSNQPSYITDEWWKGSIATTLARLSSTTTTRSTNSDDKTKDKKKKKDKKKENVADTKETSQQKDSKRSKKTSESSIEDSNKERKSSKKRKRNDNDTLEIDRETQQEHEDETHKEEEKYQSTNDGKRETKKKSKDEKKKLKKEEKKQKKEKKKQLSNEKDNDEKKKKKKKQHEENDKSVTATSTENATTNNNIKIYTDDELFIATGGARFGMRAGKTRNLAKWQRCSA